MAPGCGLAWGLSVHPDSVDTSREVVLPQLWGQHLVDSISVRASLLDGLLMNIHDPRYDSEDCSRRTELPQFAPLSNYEMVPELQLK